MSTHKIELRSIRINEKLSRETTCFAARLYVDGVLTAERAGADLRLVVAQLRLQRSDLRLDQRVL